MEIRVAGVLADNVKRKRTKTDSEMKEKVYLFGAYMGLRTNGNKGWGNFLLEFPSMPSYEDLKQEIKKRNNGLDDLVIINMQFLTKEQYYVLKGEKPDEQQSELGE